MNLHEYQAKQLFRAYSLPVAKGSVISSIDEIEAVCQELGGTAWVAKAQVHAGGRGKSGGVRLCKSLDEVKQTAKDLLGTHLVTYQTDANGQPVFKLLIEQLTDIDRECYLSLVIDRSKQALVLLVSSEGGVDIEKVADSTPEKLLHVTIPFGLPIMPYQLRQVASALMLNKLQTQELAYLLKQLVALFYDRDFSLVEINPLVLTKDGHFLCLDAKVTADDNALYRQQELQLMHDPEQEDSRETHAHEWGLSYISLQGNIGCMVNGAGLAMATMDVIQLHGGQPANFLDVGGSATQERVTEAFRIILSDQAVKGILVNIFGGIVRCDLIANGIIEAVRTEQIAIPVVVRLEGNRHAEGAELMKQSGLQIIPASSLDDAAQKVVEAVGKKA